MKRMYVYYVECVIHRNSWIDKFFVTCSNADEILPMLIATWMDNTDAWGKPREPEINIHSVRRIAHCGNGTEPSIIDVYRLFCDITPNELF